MNTVERLADVEESNGTTAVSPMVRTMRSGLTPSSRPAICAKTVRAPCPMSEVAENTETLPSNKRRTIAREADAVEELFRPSEIPRPRPGARGACQPIARSAAASAAPQSPSAGVSPGMNASPFCGRFRRRISTASMPRIRAASFSCDSTAHDACGVPNPRNAVLGVVCDSSARAWTAACGVRYGPHAA